MKRFKKLFFANDEKICPTCLARAFSMYNDDGVRVSVTSPEYCKVNMIGLYRLLFHTSISRYTKKKSEGPQKSSDVFCLMCSYHIRGHFRLALYCNIKECFFVSFSAKEMWEHGKNAHGNIVKKGNPAATRKK